jgi:hypothetical protein
MPVINKSVRIIKSLEVKLDIYGQKTGCSLPKFFPFVAHCGYELFFLDLK